LSMEKDNVDPVVLAERVARLEADVAWLKKYATANLVISVSTFIGIVVALLKIVLG